MNIVVSEDKKSVTIDGREYVSALAYKLAVNGLVNTLARLSAMKPKPTCTECGATETVGICGKEVEKRPDEYSNSLRHPCTVQYSAYCNGPCPIEPGMVLKLGGREFVVTKVDLFGIGKTYVKYRELKPAYGRQQKKADAKIDSVKPEKNANYVARLFVNGVEIGTARELTITYDSKKTRRIDYVVDNVDVHCS